MTCVQKLTKKMIEEEEDSEEDIEEGKLLIN